MFKITSIFCRKLPNFRCFLSVNCATGGQHEVPYGHVDIHRREAVEWLRIVRTAGRTLRGIGDCFLSVFCWKLHDFVDSNGKIRHKLSRLNGSSRFWWVNEWICRCTDGAGVVMIKFSEFFWNLRRIYRTGRESYRDAIDNSKLRFEQSTNERRFRGVCGTHRANWQRAGMAVVIWAALRRGVLILCCAGGRPENGCNFEEMLL